MIHNTNETINAKIIVKTKPYLDADAAKDIISYIYRLHTPNHNPLPIYCYGIPYFPPTYCNLIQAFQEIRSAQAAPPGQQLWHIIISFQLPLSKITPGIYKYIDTIANRFGQTYPVCYSCHNEKGHPHFHLILSTCSYFKDGPALETEVLNTYLSQITALSPSYGISATLTEKE